MALSFIGKPISLISHSDVRYRGILAGIDPAASTIQLSNVYSMGTESRRPPAEFIPPVQDPYQYIIFRASEVKDLAVDNVDTAPRRNVHDDPAVLGASTPTAANNFGSYNGQEYPPAAEESQANAQGSRQQQAPSSYNRAQASRGPSSEGAAKTAGEIAGTSDRAASRASNNSRRANSVHTAAASLETVERAIGDLRVSSGTGRGGRRHGRGQDIRTGDMGLPATDFDFQTSNARFDKTSVAPNKPEQSAEVDDDERTNPSDNEASTTARKEKQKEKAQEKAYNPNKSFFDTLSSSSNVATDGQGGQNNKGRGGGGRRGGFNRSRREEEREKNVATFGEPGGVGLMGPGAYVSGYGGYHRRGGRGGGRRGGGGGGVHVSSR